MTSPLLQRMALGFCAIAIAACVACGGGSDSTTPTAAATKGTSAVASTSTATTGSTATIGSTATSGVSTTTPKPPTAAPTAANQIPAIQVVLNYYRAINSQDYSTAYSLWASNGAASNQTATDFAKGFANTVRVDANLGQPAAEAAGVTVPVTVRSVVNTSSQDQSLQAFEGTYHLQLEGSDWRIKSADISQKPPPTEAAADVKEPLGALNAYYGALKSGDYARAYTYWSDEGSATGQSFAEYVLGFANTAATSATFGDPQLQGAAGSTYATVPTVIVSTQKDGSHQAFCGTYSLRSLNAPPFVLFGWSIDKADVSAVVGGVPSAAAQQHMLANSCSQ